MFGKEQFSAAFKVGQQVESGANPNAKNAAPLKILTIEDKFVRYESIRSGRGYQLNYKYLKLLLDHFDELKPKSIQKSVNVLLENAGEKPDNTTETYAYSFAKAYRLRMNEDFFLSQGESLASDPLQSEDNDCSEGRRIAVMVERIERDTKARMKCVQHYGAWCRACHFDFKKVYGSIGEDYIHIHHHRKQLAATNGKHKVDPIRDLIPLCPNCHAMVHRQKEMLSVAELQKILESVANN